MGKADRQGPMIAQTPLEGSKLKINIFFFCLYGFVVLSLVLLFGRWFFTQQNSSRNVFYGKRTMGSVQPASLGAAGHPLERVNRSPPSLNTQYLGCSPNPIATMPKPTRQVMEKQRFCA